MSHIVLGFHHASDDWISRVMAWFTHGRYTHVALVSTEGDEVIEASGMGNPKGVRMMHIDVWKGRHPGCELRKIEHPYAWKVWEHAKSQVGKPYDWGFVWGWVFRAKWQHSNRWTCNELIAWACAQAGHPLFPPEAEPDWLTPQHLYLISQPLE